MRRTRPAAIVALVLALATVGRPGPSRASLAAPTTGEPTTSTGEVRYDAAAVAFRHGRKDARAEFFIRVPYREIHFLQVDSVYEGRLRLTVELLKTKGDQRVASSQQEARVQCTALAATVDSTLGEIYTLGLTATPATYKFRVTVEDMNVARKGLVYQVHGQRRQGLVTGTLDLGSWLFMDPALSGIEFAWSVQARTEESAFGKGPYEVLPQPSAHYGLFDDSVSFYYEIYGSPPPPEGRIFRIRTRIWGGTSGDTLLNTVDSLHVTEGEAWPHAMSVDAASYPRGHYQLRLEILGPGDEVLASSQSGFDMLWSAESWIPDAADYYAVAASTLMTSEEALRFHQLSRGEKEVALEDLWRKLDPTPDTAENEAREAFRQRVAHANAEFSIFERGMFSDRGRIWIRYGEPDEILQERMPTLDKTLDYQLGDLPSTAQQSLGKTDQGTADQRPYEIWTYQMNGHELAPSVHMNEISSGLKFVFVDDQGYGDYILRYSSTGTLR